MLVCHLRKLPHRSPGRDFPNYPAPMKSKGRFYAPLPFQKLSIKKANSGRGPLLKVLLLHLSGGGSILTLSANHTGIDAGALGHLLMRWSFIAGGTGKHVLAENGTVPLFDRRVYLSSVTQAQHTRPALTSKAQEAMLELMEELMDASMRPPPTARQTAAEWKVILTSLATTWRGPGMPVTTPILYVPQSDLSFLKERLMKASGRRLSTNDALCALMWHVCCDLRGRPPPGSRAPEQGYMVAIVDLRGRHLPESYCGAGYLPCNIPGGANTPLQRLQRRGRTPPEVLRAAAEVDHYCCKLYNEKESPTSSMSQNSEDGSEEEDAESRLAATAVRIRLAIGLMSDAAVVGRLANRLVSAQKDASPAATVLCTARGCVDADMLSSSWTKFPFLEMDLGNGKADASYGLAVSRKPYIWNNFMAPDGGMYIAMHVATLKEERFLKDHPWWPSFLPGARFMP
eukprot:jgi/Botrbrau1/19543/Bobra.0035s0035.1